MEETSTMKRICMVRHGYYPGMQPNMRNAETLVSHGHEVDIICLGEKGEKRREVVRGVRVYRLQREHRRRGLLRYAFEYATFFFLAFWKLSWLSLKRRYQVVEVSGIPDFLVFSAIIPRLLGATVILFLLDHTPGVFADSFGLGPNHVVVKLLRLVERISARWADYCIGTQIVNKQILESHGVPSSKISVVLNVPAVDFSNYQASPSNDNGTFSLITHGHLLKRYAVQTLIRAVPLLIEEIPYLKVRVVGDGEYRPELEQLAQSLGIAEYVDFTGWVPQVKVPEYISEAHIGVVVIPSGMNPAMPNKLLEYLAMGKPAVVTDIPAIKAYFDDNSVMYYEPDNEHDLAHCILELYRNPEKRAALAASASAVYQQYRWPVMKYEYLKVFDKL
jgi:glycosyltransferase involved in cell wall biosynthesis